MSQPTPELLAAPTQATRLAAGCFHCGEPCAPDAFSLDGKPFCCFGCQTVFSLLRENGLAQFYELNDRPGTRIRATAVAAKWAFLDDPTVREKLLDYADKAQAKVTLHLPAIHCVACVWLLENLFNLHPGIGHSQVNFSRREAAITFAPSQIKFSELVALLASIGYEPEFTLASGPDSQTPDARSQTQNRKAWLQIGLAGFAFGNIMLMALPFYFGLDSLNGPWFERLAGWLGLAFALPVVTYSASDYWRAAWLGFRRWMITIEVPIALGLAALYGASIYQVAWQHGPGYGDSLCGLIFFLLCGRLFQKKTHERLTFDRDYKGFFPLSVVRLTERQPPARRRSGSAKLERAGPAAAAPQEEVVAISRLQVGDRIILRNGELLPADACLVGGEACLDYSFVTGESQPVAARAGDRLYAGGRQVGGAIQVETVKPVAQSYLATLWDNEAFRKPHDHDLDSLTNRFSKYFTKLVVGLALAAAVFWVFSDAAKALKVCISVLIVACPCALALAAPLTHGTAQRLLARLNIFLKNGLVVERMAEVNAIVLDKTGTLTTADAGGVEFIPATDSVSLTPGFNRGLGHEVAVKTVSTVLSERAKTDKSVLDFPVGNITGLEPGVNESMSRKELNWIGSLTRLSTHPNSIRIAESVSLAALPVTGFKETPGGGIEGEVAGHTLLLGSQAWLEKQGVNVGPASRPSQNLSSEIGDRRDACPRSIDGACLAIDGEFRGSFKMENSLRPEVAQLIAELGGRFELVLLSGDNEREAARFRKFFGKGATLKFNQSPADKLNFIRELQERGRRVMMVGDGLNDAGALKQAEVGVAVVERVGVFSPASDVILDAAQLPRLAQVLRFSRQAAHVVRAAFVISAIYNVVGVGIAAAGLLSPIICAILMPLSSATVVVFTTGMTVWLGRKLTASPKVPDASRRDYQPSTLNSQLLPKEAA